MPILYRRTWNSAVRTEYAAVTWQWLKPLAAALAVIKVLASASWHLFFGLMTALGASDGGLQDHINNSEAFEQILQ
jgi:hypothetical protein